jgi:hypothetical protein
VYDIKQNSNAFKPNGVSDIRSTKKPIIKGAKGFIFLLEL